MHKSLFYFIQEWLKLNMAVKVCNDRIYWRVNICDVKCISNISLVAILNILNLYSYLIFSRIFMKISTNLISHLVLRFQVSLWLCECVSLLVVIQPIKENVSYCCEVGRYSFVSFILSFSFFLLYFSLNYRDFSVKSRVIISLFLTVKWSLLVSMIQNIGFSWRTSRTFVRLDDVNDVTKVPTSNYLVRDVRRSSAANFMGFVDRNEISSYSQLQPITYPVNTLEASDFTLNV